MGAVILLLGTVVLFLFLFFLVNITMENKAFAQKQKSELWI